MRALCPSRYDKDLSEARILRKVVVVNISIGK